MLTLKTPIVLIIYKRAETTKKVMEAITRVRPERLFVVAEGPRSELEAGQVAATRKLIEQVAWDCDVRTNYSDNNLGLKERIVSGIHWVFNQTDEAIILEDDCVPHPSFFFFCQELLADYRDDDRIMSICGVNYQFGHNPTPYSYYFSIYNHVSGWATWRRAWHHFDGGMTLWPEARDNRLLSARLHNQQALRYWTKRFEDVYDGRIDSWAYCWTFASWLQNGLAIIPSVNLISNIGTGIQATHSHGRRDPRMHMPVEEMIFPLKHPPFVIPNAGADRYTQKRYYRNRLLAPLKRKLKLFLSQRSFTL